MAPFLLCLSAFALSAASGLLPVGPFATAQPSEEAAPSTDLPATFAIHVQIASVDGNPVVPADWFADQVAAANRTFAPSRVSFTLADRQVTNDVQADLVTRADRHRLGPRVDREAPVIHAFVVRSMADVDVADHMLRGVHWRSRRGGSPCHFVVVTSIAGRHVLAHELGHFFGNPHSPTPGNIMSYTRGDGPPFFDAGQLRRIRRTATHMLESGELVDRSAR